MEPVGLGKVLRWFYESCESYDMTYLLSHLNCMKEECRGLNECMLETHNCHEHAICINSIDSFECTCNDGFSGNGTICEDKDECSTGGNFL